jgi:hypothetical protein
MKVLAARATSKRCSGVDKERLTDVLKSLGVDPQHQDKHGVSAAEALKAVRGPRQIAVAIFAKENV